MKKLAVLALALSTVFTAHAGGKQDPLMDVYILGSYGDLIVYDKPCKSVVNKGEEGFIGVRNDQAACLISEGNRKTRIEWISTGQIERLNNDSNWRGNDPSDPMTKDEFLARNSGDTAKADKIHAAAKDTNVSGAYKLAVANGHQVYDKQCTGFRGADGKISVSKLNGSRGCFIEEGNDMYRIEWEDTGKVERVYTLTATDLVTNKQFSLTVNQPKPQVAAPTRADVNRTLNAPRYDQYGRPLKSTAELCAEAQRMGGPVTQTCAWERWSR